MDKQFKISVNQEHIFHINSDDAVQLDEVISENGIAHLLENNKSAKAEITEANFFKRTYSINLNGSQYKVHIENKLDMLIEEMGLSLGSNSVANEIHAPMPGLIIEVNVAVGDIVQKGDFLCVLEAMKMENTLSSPREGVVKSVNIVKGETVDKGVLLIELKAE